MTLRPLALAIFLLAFAGAARQTTRPPVPTTPAAATLPGTAWNAIELAGIPVPANAGGADRGPHLIFGADGRISGSDGCNRVTGPYTVKGDTLSFGLFAATQMACVETGDLATRFHAALAGTRHWRIEKGHLRFYGASGKPLAVFVPRKVSAAGTSMPLEGTTWQLVRFTGGIYEFAPVTATKS